jgi:molybdenum cofactor cytidylyltransferase
VSGTRHVAAIVLAAGRSSRMGAAKPLLPIGSSSAIDRVVGSVARALVDDIVVVTGHDRASVAPVIHGLPAGEAHNPRYDSGMFSSVRVGVAALDKDVEAFFVLPADYALVRSEVMERLAAEFAAHGTGVLHPTCCGLRGHPPLIAGRHRDALLRADDGDNLRGFLQREAEDEAELEVEDLTILMDMDTDDDYRRICRFAAVLDAAAPVDTAVTAVARPASPAMSVGARAPTAVGPATNARQAPGAGARLAGGSPVLSPEDALYLLSLLDVPDRVVRHCQTVASVGQALARALKPHQPGLDVDLVQAAGLLHDLARVRPDHAAAGRDLLRNLGLHRLGEVVGAHMVLTPEQADMSRVTEEQLVYLADKLVAEDEIVGLEERRAATLRSWGDGFAAPEALEGLEARMQAARLILRKVEGVTGHPASEILRPLKMRRPDGDGAGSGVSRRPGGGSV